MPFGVKLRKKPWDKEYCVFVLQEYGATGEKGWTDITEPTGVIPTKEEAMEHFQPGRSYRVMARYTDGPRAGQLAGMVWKHFEPFPAGLKPKEKKPKPKVEKAPPRKDAADIMGEYVDEFVRVATPLAKLNEALEGIRNALGVAQTQPVAEGASYEIPPLTFTGSAPWLLHPYIVKTVADEVKSVLDYGFTRAEKMMGVEEEAALEEEEELGLPSIREYARRRAPTEEVGAPPREEEEAPPPVELVEEKPEEEKTVFEHLVEKRTKGEKKVESKTSKKSKTTK